MGCGISRSIQQENTCSVHDEDDDSVIIVVGYVSDGSESGSHNDGSRHRHRIESLHSDTSSKNGDGWGSKRQDEPKDSELVVQGDRPLSPVYELDGGYDGGDRKEPRLQNESDKESVKVHGTFLTYELDGDYYGVAEGGNASGMDIKLQSNKFRPIKRQLIKPQIDISQPKVAEIQVSCPIYKLDGGCFEGEVNSY